MPDAPKTTPGPISTDHTHCMWAQREICLHQQVEQPHASRVASGAGFAISPLGYAAPPAHKIPHPSPQREADISQVTRTAQRRRITRSPLPWRTLAPPWRVPRQTSAASRSYTCSACVASIDAGASARIRTSAIEIWAHGRNLVTHAQEDTVEAENLQYATEV